MYNAITLLLTLVTLLVLSKPVACFGAGEIPDWGYLNDKAFRHGDIEGILSNLAKNVGGAAANGGLMGIAASVLSAASGSSKFGRMDVKRVYFGNWLRDYSQAMDIAGLSKLTAQTLVTVVSVLGFMTFGFATAEFEISADRLGVYLPIEHIDNPKGYAEKEGDARHFHPKLRPPVDPRELEVNPRTGMKNYIATEGHSWDTSSAHVRRTLKQCIAHGRRARGAENDDQWEAFRLLGTALHTLEDLLAHSNWCELALRKNGHKDVFCHVGDSVVINTPNGSAPPLVTGTFGSADFMHSVLGEGIDHLSEASVSSLTSKMDDAKSQGDGPISTLKGLLSKMPSFGDSSNEEKMEQAENIKNEAYDFNPNDVAPEDVQHQMWQILEWRDSIYRDILKKIEMVPGLSELVDELIDALNAYVFTVLDPVIKPILQQATGVLQDGSKAVIDTDDQYEASSPVFNDPRASDPSHSMLSKDHFNLILNEPAGKIAQVVVEYSVNLIVKAWYDDEDPNRVIDQILEAFHHPYFATGNSDIQRQMMDHLERWIGALGSDERQQTLQALTKESVRAGKNKRLGSDDDTGQSGGAYVGYGYEQKQTPYSDDNAYRHSQNTESGYGDGQYGSSLGKRNEGPRYEIRPSQPVYARFDSHQEKKEPERHHHRSENTVYSSSDQYGEGRHVSRDQYAAVEELDSRRRAKPIGRGAYDEDTPPETSYGQRDADIPSSLAAESEHSSRTSYNRTESSSYREERHHYSHREHHTKSRNTEYGERSPSYGQEGSYAQFSRAADSGYGYSSQGGNNEYVARSNAYAEQSHHTAGSAFGKYGSSGVRVDAPYGGETLSYSHRQSYGHSEDPSDDFLGDYSRGNYDEGGGHHRHQETKTAYVLAAGNDPEDVSETFGAERLALKDTQRNYASSGYGQSREERNYYE